MSALRFIAKGLSAMVLCGHVSGVLAQSPAPPVPGAEVSPQLPITISGTNRMYFETANNPRFGQDLPATFFRWELEPVLIVSGIPLSGRIMYTTEEPAPGSKINGFEFGLNFSSDRLTNLLRERVSSEIANLEQSTGLSDVRAAYQDVTSTVSGIQGEVSGRLEQLQDLRDDFSDIGRNLDQLKQVGLLKAQEQLALRFPTIGIGTTFPRYNKYSINGVAVTGVDVVFEPGFMHIGGTFGNIRNPRPGERTFTIGVDSLAFSRQIIGAKVGFGRTNANHLTFSGAVISDDPQSLALNGGEASRTPERNALLGMDFDMAFGKQTVTLTGEGVVSAYTRDVEAPLLDEDFSRIPLIPGLVDANTSSSVDAALNAKAVIRNPGTDTKVSLETVYVGPGYVSLGAPSYRNDLSRIQAVVEQRFAKRQVRVSARVRTQRDNLADYKKYTSSQLQSTFNLGLNFRRLPYLRVMYAPTTQTTQDFLVDVADSLAGNVQQEDLRYDASVLMVSAGHRYGARRGLNGNTGLTLTTQSFGSNSGAVDFATRSLSLTQGVYLNNIRFTGSYTLLSRTSGSAPEDLRTLGLSADYTIAPGYGVSLGLLSSNEADLSSLRRVYAVGYATIPMLGVLNVRVENSNFTSEIFADSNFAQSMLIASLTRSF